MLAVRNLLTKVLFAGLLSGCARESGEAHFPSQGAAPGWVLGASDYSWPPRVSQKSSEVLRPAPVLSPLRFAAAPGVPTYADGRPRPLAPERVAAEIPAGDACLEQLRLAGVKFESATDKRGVETPVTIKGPIGSIRYWSAGAGEMVADCRLALGLSKIGPELARLGVTSVRFSGAYSYRMAKVGRLSLHAYGLALDVHAVTANGQNYEVQRDFARGLANGCSNDGPLLNRVACRLAQLRLFQELLTPDSNADHHDHLHLALARAPN